MASIKTAAFAGVSLLALAACDDPNYRNTQTGAAIGAATGAAATIIAGGDRDKIAAATVLGGVAGAVIGNVIDKQEADLRQDLSGSGAVITRDGNRLIVTLPEAITFDTDSVYVRNNLVDDLGRLAANLQQYPDSTVDVIGHTDSVGDASYNQNLSARRASAVETILLQNGVANSRIRAYGRGETQPVASNDTASGRAANRRVEIVINPTR